MEDVASGMDVMFSTDIIFYIVVTHSGLFWCSHRSLNFKILLGGVDC